VTVNFFERVKTAEMSARRSFAIPDRVIEDHEEVEKKKREAQ
jgi:hypothetical protein